VNGRRPTRGTRYKDGYLQNEVDFLDSHHRRLYSRCDTGTGRPYNQCHAAIWHPTNRTPGKHTDRQTDGRTDRRSSFGAGISSQWWYIVSNGWFVHTYCVEWQASHAWHRIDAIIYAICSTESTFHEPLQNVMRVWQPENSRHVLLTISPDFVWLSTTEKDV